MKEEIGIGSSEYFLEVFSSVTERLVDPSFTLIQDTLNGVYRRIIYFPLENRLMVGYISDSEDWQEENFTTEQVKEACLFYAKID